MAVPIIKATPTLTLQVKVVTFRELGFALAAILDHYEAVDLVVVIEWTKIRHV